MRCKIKRQLNRALGLGPLLAVLFALLPQFAQAQRHHALHTQAQRHHALHAQVQRHHVLHLRMQAHHRARHSAAGAQNHPLLAPVVHHVRQSSGKQFRAHPVAAQHVRRMPVAAHQYAHATLHSRSQQLVRHTFARDPLARHLAPNAPPMVFGAPVTSSLLYSLAAEKIQVCLLCPRFGRAPPSLL
jgi:hypothetical protein